MSEKVHGSSRCKGQESGLDRLECLHDSSPNLCLRIRVFIRVQELGNLANDWGHADKESLLKDFNSFDQARGWGQVLFQRGGWIGPRFSSHSELVAVTSHVKDK